MASLKILIYDNEIIACHQSKKMLKNFIDQFELKNYEFDKIPYVNITPEQEYYVEEKEIRYDEHYGVYANDYLLQGVAYVLEGVAEEFIEIDEMIDDILEYVKVTNDERDNVSLLSGILHDIAMDIVGCDECSGPQALFGDYFDIEQVMRDILHGKIVIEPPK